MDKKLTGRYYCFTIIVRLNQIEVAPNVYLGFDERAENTPQNLKKYREAIAKAVPSAKITIAFSHSALQDESEQYQELRRLAKEYANVYGDDITYIIGGYFVGAYIPRVQAKAHIDEALQLLKNMMGEKYLPKSVIGGFLPSEVLEHLSNRGIHVAQGNIFSQYYVDNQDGEGSICYPYYPSKEHFCKPAQNTEDFIDCVNFDGWTVDFLCATYCGITAEGYNSRMGCGPIETLRPYGNEKGIEIMLNTADQMLGENFYRNGNFGLAASIWELCLIEQDGSHAMHFDGDTVYTFFKRLSEKYPDLEIITLGELGERFREVNKDNRGLDYRFVHQGMGVGGSLANEQISWYMNDTFRMAIKKDLLTSQERIIDFTNYTKNYCEPKDSDYAKGESNRSWSLLGDINQKGLREQDKPIALDALTEEQKRLLTFKGITL
ncbi:MAG: DUF3863 domain-containing protein [Clostridiales bacterium]|nr:DUF3863 domain-containing protein [Clostridiales bacterium]